MVPHPLLEVATVKKQCLVPFMNQQQQTRLKSCPATTNEVQQQQEEQTEEEVEEEPLHDMTAAAQ